MDDDVENALEAFWILHADHEQNCSTSTVTHGGQRPGEFLCIDFGGDCRSLGSASRWRQPGGD
ncbi:MAG: citrate/2-methylcitrate synthase [Desulfobacterales bacterium]|nr:citrate/2-methylcitrate synthase [Desulfobacterales bacterium]